jgi:hypothetical protein
MRFVHAAWLLAVTASPALAQRGPVVVIPGRPDVPVFENGTDISWAVVEGEFGLDRPGQVTPTVIYRLPPPVITTYEGAAANEPGYFPKDGKKPGYGRLEIVPGPNRPLPPPAQSYRRSWSSESDPTPADLPSSYPPNYIAPIIAPTINPPGPPGPWGAGRGPGGAGIGHPGAAGVGGAGIGRAGPAGGGGAHR